MTLLVDWIREAVTDVGLTECQPRKPGDRCPFTGHTGPGANHTKYAAEAGLPNGVYWCAVRASAIAKRTGLQIAGFPTASTRTIKNAAVEAGTWVTRDQIAVGDVPVFNLTNRNGVGQPDHTGICVAVDHDKGTVTTSDGNTSSGPGGSEDNGGGVFIRTRPLSSALGASRPTFTAAPLPTPPKEEEMKPVTYKVSIDPQNSKADPNDYDIWVTPDWVHTYKLGGDGDIHGRNLHAYPPSNIFVPKGFHQEMLNRTPPQ